MKKVIAGCPSPWTATSRVPTERLTDSKEPSSTRPRRRHARGREVMTLCDVREQTRVRRLPAEKRTRARARRQVVELGQHAEEATERVGGLVGRNALRRHA